MASKATMTASAAAGARNPKKVGAQAAISPICQPQRRKAGRALGRQGSIRRHSSQAETPRSPSASVQIVMKLRAGKVSGGRRNDRYQWAMSLPATPTAAN